MSSEYDFSPFFDHYGINIFIILLFIEKIKTITEIVVDFNTTVCH